MISIIIPLMPIEPYVTQVNACLQSLRKQTAEHEVIVERHEIQEYIEKNRLLNQGVEIAKGDIIWFCDADFLLPDSNLLKRMEAKLREDNLDVIYPMFYSDAVKGYKIADGATFIKKNVLARFGKLHEKLNDGPANSLLMQGISRVTWPLLDWCLDNAKMCVLPFFLIELNYEPFSVKGKGTSRVKSEMKLRYPKLIKRLKARGYRPG